LHSSWHFIIRRQKCRTICSTLSFRYCPGK
jgi:hypothetical protein